MRLIYMDRTEGLSYRGSFSLSSAYAQYLGVLGSFGTGSMRVYDGLVSPAAMALQSGSSYYIELGEQATQNSGKFACGVAFNKRNFVGSGLVSVLRLNVNGSNELLQVDAETGYVTFMGETSADLGRTVENVEAVNYFEVEIDIDAGKVSVYVNDLLFIEKQVAVSSVSNLVRLTTSGGSSSNRGVYDDIYILGGTDGPYQSRLGPVRAVRAPLALETQTDFTPIGAETNIEAVNKTDLDTDSYTRSPATDDTRDMYKLDLSAVPDDKPIIAVSHQLYHMKTDIGPRRLQAIAKLGNDEQAELLSDSIATYSASEPIVLSEKPGGGGWSYEDLENAEFGYEVIEHE